MLTEIGAIMVKVESPAGTEAVTDQVVYAENLAINPTGEFIERAGRGAFHGPEMTGVIGGRHGKCTFSTDMRTDGSQGFEAGLAILIQACNYVQTLEVYTIAKIATQKTITIEVWQDGLLKVLYGAAGKFTIDYATNKRVMFNFDFDGLYKAEADEAVPAYVPTGDVIMFGDGSFTVLGNSHMISKFTFDSGNIVVAKYDVAGPGGILHYQTTYPKPTCSWDPETAVVATDALHADWLAGVTAGALALAVSNGTDKVTLDCGKVQYMAIPEGARDNIRTHEVKVQCLETHATVPTMAKFTVAAA